MAEPNDQAHRDMQRKLHEVSLDDSIRGNMYVSDFDKPRTETIANDQNVAREMRLLEEKADLIPGATPALKANYMAVELSKSRGNKSHIEIRKVEDRTAELKVSHFKPGMNIERGMNVAQILGDTFNNYPFGTDELKKAEMEYFLLDYAIKKVTARVIDLPDIGPGAPTLQQFKERTDFKKRQLELLFARLESLEVIKHRRDQDEKIVKKSKVESLRSNTIAANRHNQMVTPPIFGDRSNLQADVFKKLLANMNNITFGSELATQDLKSYLEIVKSVCENEYSERATYQALLYVLSKEPRQFAENSFKDHYPLEWTWVQLQLGWGKKVSKANYPSLITEAMQTRPENVAQSLLKIASLIRCKNEGMEHDERIVYNNIEIKKFLLNFLTTWYPYHISTIEQRFHAIELEKREIGGKQPPHDHTLVGLAESVLADVQPIRVSFDPPRRNRPYINALASEDAVQEDRMLRLALEEPNDANIHAFQSADSKMTNFGGPNRPRGPSFVIPVDFRNRCLKCGSDTHFMKFCPKYKNSIQSKPCEYCQCYHSEKCLNIAQTKIHEMSSPKDPFKDAPSHDNTQ